MNNMTSSSHACVGPDDVIIAKGNKKRMGALVKKKNRETDGRGYYLGLTQSKQVGEKFK